jgi:hypothetical protein
MRRAAWRVMFVPAAVVVHRENQSPLNERLVTMYTGLYAFCSRHYSRSQQMGVRAATVAALLPRWLLAPSSPARAQYARIMRLPVAEAKGRNA